MAQDDPEPEETEETEESDGSFTETWTDDDGGTYTYTYNSDGSVDIVLPNGDNVFWLPKGDDGLDVKIYTDTDGGVKIEVTDTNNGTVETYDYGWHKGRPDSGPPA